MKSASQILSAITDAIGGNLNETKLAEMKLANGTLLEAEEFAKGNEIFIKTEDEKVPLPEGLYELEDGKTLVIVDEGIIDDIKEESTEQIENEMVNESLQEEKEEKKEEMNYATREELAEIKTAIEEMKKSIEDMKSVKEEDMSEQKAVAEEVKQEVEELKEELSKPAAEPKKHNPETENKKGTFLYGNNRPLSTRDRVFEKIANIKRNNN